MVLDDPGGIPQDGIPYAAGDCQEQGKQVLQTLLHFTKIMKNVIFAWYA
jgi:hypothetical protein